MSAPEMFSQLQNISANTTELTNTIEKLLNADIPSLVKELEAKYEKALMDTVKNTPGSNASNITQSAFNFENYIRRAYYGSNKSYPTGLPILYLYGNTTGMSKSNKVDLEYKYGDLITGYTSGTCTCKWQGNSSINFRKKNYTIAKMSNPIDVGWGSHNKYVLKSHHNDYSMARNVVSAKLWGEMVKTRTGTDAITRKLKTLPNGGAIDGFPIMVVINNVFQGVYVLSIPKDDWMFGMGSGDRECVLSCEAASPATLMTDSTLTKEQLLAENPMSYEYISDEDDIDWAVTSYNTMVNALKLTSGANWEDDVSGYIDIDSFIDSFVFHYITGNDDVVNKNSITATYDGMKWFRSVYDLDQTFGGHFIGHVTKYPKSGVTMGGLSNNRVWGLLYTQSKPKLKARYNAVRNTVFSEENVFTKFDNFIRQIPRNVRLEDTAIWYDIPGTGIDPVSQIMEWYRLRLQITDAAMAAM